jgi:hypothetical protein
LIFVNEKVQRFFVRTRFHAARTQGRLRQTGWRIVILDGARRTPLGKPFVTAPID